MLFVRALTRKLMINHIRHFIKIPFINKGIDFINLLRDNTVESSIPNYFENKDPSIICYKYNKPIRSTILNFNRFVADLDIESNTRVHDIAKTQNYQPAGHIILENLKLISDSRICSIISKGPNLLIMVQFLQKLYDKREYFDIAIVHFPAVP